MKIPATLALVLAATLQARAADHADHILFNAHVVTADPAGTTATTIAVAGEKIAYVGSRSGAEKLRGPDTRMTDLGGRTVLPGIIDSHTHPVGAAMVEFDHEVPDMRSVPDVLDYVRSRAAAVGDGAWVVVQQVFITRLEEKRYPTRAELDTAAPDNPVVFRTGPDASLNSLALAHFKIGPDTPAPGGSKIERGADGEPTGILRGYARLISVPGSPGPSPTDDDRLGRLRLLFRDYSASGLTGIIDRNASRQAMQLYRRLLDSGQLDVRIGMSRGVGNDSSAGSIRQDIAAIAAEPAFTGPDPMLRTVGIKMFLDGGMLTGSAYMRQPWGVSRTYGISDPAYRGLRFIPEEKLAAAVEACVDHGLQFTAHSVGDGAVHALLDVYEKTAATRDIRPSRPNLTHANFMSAEAVSKMAALGVSADIQPAWLYLDTRTLTGHFGQDRLTYFQPLRSLFEAGVAVGGGSDHMQKVGSLRSINPYNPFLGMWVSITRRARGFAGQLHPEQALDRMQALRFYTNNNAYLMFMEDQVGSLEPGKFADFIVIDRDYLTCPTDEIRQIKVLQTWLAGRKVFER